MKNIIIPIMTIVILLASAASVSADIDITIYIDEVFHLNDIVSFNYSIKSDSEVTVNYLPRISCPDAPINFLDYKEVNLEPNEIYRYTYQDITIDDSIEPQICTAYVEILEPIQDRTEKTFEIKTLPRFEFEILMDKKVFLKNEDIYLNYDSEITKPAITAAMTYPDKTTEQITLPTTIKAKQIGTYNLEATASKQGYKTMTKKVQFGVIEEEADVPYLKEDKKEEKGINLTSIAIISLSIIIVIVVIFEIYRRRK